nr:nucleic acid-binding, OB-fold-like protein [Tanacetum cinerariifolium]
AVNDVENLSEIQMDVSLLQKPEISVDRASKDENESNSEIEDIKKSYPTKIEGELSADMKLEDLLAIYDQEKYKYLSSFVGQV